MSYDLLIATHQRAEQDALVRFIETELGGAAEGTFASGGNIVVEYNNGDSRVPVMTIDPPERVTEEELVGPLADAATDLEWELLVSVPEGARPVGVPMALRVGTYIAERWQGAVYDPQQDLVIWPGGTRQRPAESRDERVDVVFLEWFMPIRRLQPGTSSALLRILAERAPRALPRKYNGRRWGPDAEKLWQRDWDGLLADRAEPPLTWDADTPWFGGSVSVNPRADRLYKGQAAAWSIGLDVDKKTLDTDARQREAVVACFIAVAREFGAFYAEGRVVRGYILERGELYADGETEERTILHTWSGLPDTPAWLTWYGPQYADRLAPVVARVVTDRIDGGLFVRMGDVPADRHALEPVFPAIPRDLTEGVDAAAGWMPDLS